MQTNTADVGVIQNISAQASRASTFCGYTASPDSSTLERIQNVISGMSEAKLFDGGKNQMYRISHAGRQRRIRNVP
jgi:hypothetical protein